jgi:hypothetical protein
MIRQLARYTSVFLLAACGDPGQGTEDVGNTASTSQPADTGDASPVADDVAAAVTVLRGYYAAIDAGEYERAYLLWGDSGRSSNQSLEEFRDGFGDTASTEVVVGEPGRVEGAAGSRFIEIPVEIVAVDRSGGTQRFAGSYVLRRVVVDGATEAQRRWHLFSADLAACPGECVPADRNDDVAEVTALVREFGRRLRLVSTLGPREEASRAVREQYAPFVTPALLESWAENPAGAAGRVVSNPWPRGIDVAEVSGSGDVRTVSGTVALVATADTAQVLEREPVTIEVVRSGGRWRIASVTR